MNKDLNKLTRKELAEELYKAKKQLGENITPIGRTTPLTKQEFTKRYLNGVGGTKGFKKDKLKSLLESRLNKIDKQKSKTATVKKCVNTQKNTATKKPAKTTRKKK